MLVKNSFIVLCQYFFEIIIQLKWILSLEESRMQEAIKLFLEFQGIRINVKGKHVYESHHLMDIEPNSTIELWLSALT